MEKDDRRILVCGGRDYENKDGSLFDTLDMLDGKLDGIDLVITGGQKTWVKDKEKFIGADYFAELWAKSRGIDIRVFEAKWKTYGRSAGPIRNGQMLTEGKPNLVVAFKGGKGTRNMITQAKKKGVMVMEIV